MRKLIATVIMMTLVLGLVPMLMPVTVQAQKQYAKRVVGKNGRVRYVRVKKPSFYRRHRNRSNIAIGTGGGAILGAIVGGKKGALIGAGAGAGSSALYTYVFNKKKRKYVRVRRR
jgi:hypothetical protein